MSGGACDVMRDVKLACDCAYSRESINTLTLAPLPVFADPKGQSTMVVRDTP